MEYLDKAELKRLFKVAHDANKLHHLAMVVGLWHGARVSEVVHLTGDDVQNGTVYVDRLKGSEATRQPIHKDIDPLFDETPVVNLAKERGSKRLFPFSRQRADQFVKKYGKLAGLPKEKLHFHTLKHSIALLLWDKTQSLGMIQSYLGHKSAGSTLCYLREADSTKAQSAVAGIQI